MALSFWPFNRKTKEQQKKKKKKIIWFSSIGSLVVAGGAVAVILLLFACKGGGGYTLTSKSVNKFMKTLESPSSMSDTLEHTNTPGSYDEGAFEFLTSQPMKQIAYGLCDYYLLDWATNVEDETIKLNLSCTDSKFEVKFINACEVPVTNFFLSGSIGHIAAGSFVQISKTNGSLTMKLSGRVSGGTSYILNQTFIFNNLSWMEGRIMSNSDEGRIMSNSDAGNLLGGFYEDTGGSAYDKNDPSDKEGFVFGFWFDSSDTNYIPCRYNTKSLRYRMLSPGTNETPASGFWSHEWDGGGSFDPTKRSFEWYKDEGSVKIEDIDSNTPWRTTFAFFLSKSQYPNLSCDIKLGSTTAPNP